MRIPTILYFSSATRDGIERLSPYRNTSGTLLFTKQLCSLPSSYGLNVNTNDMRSASFIRSDQHRPARRSMEEAFVGL